MTRPQMITYIENKMNNWDCNQEDIDNLVNRSDEELYLLCCIRRQANNNGFTPKDN